MVIYSHTFKWNYFALLLLNVHDEETLFRYRLLFTTFENLFF